MLNSPKYTQNSSDYVSTFLCIDRSMYFYELTALFSGLVQNLVNKMWVGVASEEKAELRSCLPKLLLSQHAAMPFFIKNKLCKVIVDIGRQDWPMFYHDFFSNTLQVRLIAEERCCTQNAKLVDAEPGAWCQRSTQMSCTPSTTLAFHCSFLSASYLTI